jgi:hypothetical protein
MMKLWRQILIAGVTLSQVSVTVAYEVSTHRDISLAASESSRLSATLPRLGLRPLDLGDSAQQFPAFVGGPTTNGRVLTISELIQFGAAWEDDVSWFQPLRHFYDPVNDKPLDVGGRIGTSLSTKSADWALEDLGSHPQQDYSYGDTRNDLYIALTAGSEVQRRKYFGATFQGLGHVMHHLQDMAQPQHVRNEPHCDIKLCALLTSAVGGRMLDVPSLYEKYTNLADPRDPYRQVRPNLPFSGPGSTPTYPGVSWATTPFATPRSFWRTTAPGTDISQGKGIAEYTNRNFYSAGSIGTYPSPTPPRGLTEYFQPAETVDISTLLPGTTLTGKVKFWGSEVTDALSGGPPVTNRRALSEGILDSDLVQFYGTASPGYLVYALNRFTFDAAHQFLIPRAVAYSAGLINFFFRGELEISLPDEGVYGVIDHNVAANASPQTGGFPKIKVKLRNVTPAGTDAAGNPIVEPMTEGSSPTLVAVVKFHRNLCYAANLSGEYGSPGMDWTVCRSPSEEIVVSDPVSVPAGINTSPQDVTFSFPNRVPISATDMYLQVVYRGPLGEEADAVVVATRDISEPRYIHNYARWDQYTYAHWPSVDGGPYSWAEWCAQGGYASLGDCNRDEGQTIKAQYSPTANPIPGYDPDAPTVPPNTWMDTALEPPFTPVMTLPAPVGTLARVAVLTDANPTNVALQVVEWGASPTGNRIFTWDTGVAAATRNQVDPETGALIPSVTYLPGRGVYLPTAENYLLTSGSAPSIPPLVLVPSQIRF